MVATQQRAAQNGRAQYGEQTQPDGAAILAQSIEAAELKIQMEQSRSWPRSVKEFMRRATDMATLNEDTAASCFYSVPRAGKQIEGPSIRLAEICALAWGNLRYGSRFVGEKDRSIVVEGFCHDMEMNNQSTEEVSRRITNKDGKRYGDDMIQTTTLAASSIAIRNAIYRIIPRVYVEQIAANCRQIVAGKIETLAGRRGKAIDYLKRYGVTQERICHALGRKGVEDITCDDMVTLKGMTTALVEKHETVDVLFPDPKATPKAQTLAGLADQMAKQNAEASKQSDLLAPDADYAGETVTEEELAVRDKIGELSRQLGMDPEKAESEQANYFKTRSMNVTVSALRAYANHLEGRMERE